MDVDAAFLADAQASELAQPGDAADDALFDAVYGAELGFNGIGKVSSKGVASRKGYAGYEHDESIVMYHVRHRVYRPDLGRWMTRDPLGYVDGMGLYEYVQMRSVLAVDPSGEAMHIVGWCVVGGAIKGGLGLASCIWNWNGTACKRGRCQAAGGCIQGAMGAALGPWGNCIGSLVGNLAACACEEYMNVGSCGDTCTVVGMVLDSVIQCIGPFLPKDQLKEKEKLILLLLGIDGSASKWAACNSQPRNDPTKRWIISSVTPTATIVRVQEATRSQSVLRTVTPVAGCTGLGGGHSSHFACFAGSCSGSGLAEY